MNERFQRGSVQEIQQKCSVGRDPTHGAVGKPKGLIPPPSPPPIRLELDQEAQAIFNKNRGEGNS